jgi:hypothetical protein
MLSTAILFLSASALLWDNLRDRKGPPSDRP